MGSSSLEEEEEDLVRMVQDFIEFESTCASPSSGTGTWCNCCSNFTVKAINHPTADSDNYYLVLQEILRSCTAAESKVMKCVLKHMTIRKKGDKTSSSTSTASLRKWLVMILRMDDHLNASLCQTCWPTSLGCPSGEYEYIDVMIEEENGNVIRVIVDLDFKSQFEVARPSESYRKLTDSLLPVIYVGSENKLSRIISLLCCAAKQSLSEKGLHVPPWRTTSYMQSKWLSEKQREGKCVGKEKSYKAKAGAALHAIDNSKWVPPTPILKPKKRNSSGQSALSSQFSNSSATINFLCC